MEYGRAFVDMIASQRLAGPASNQGFGVLTPRVSEGPLSLSFSVLR